MNKVIKNSIVIVLIGVALLSIYFGSYLPLVKAKRYIAANQALSSVKSVEDFTRNFDRAFNFYSPVGDEEITKFLSQIIFEIAAAENQNEDAVRALVHYIEPYLFKNNVRHLLNGGGLYFRLWNSYGRQQEDFDRAEVYYLKALAIGPKLPPVLYSLFDFYRAAGETDKAKAVAETILKYWPEDEKVKEILR